MDPIKVLGQQSQNKINSDYMRLKNGENRIPGDPTPSKNVSVPQFLKKDVENKNPESTGKGFRSGSSRLPVLAKSLNLQVAKEFAKSHKSWEDKPLAGKSKSKKPCTKPVPFNFSQPRSKGTASRHQGLLGALTPRAGSDENTSGSMDSKRNNVNAKTLSKEFSVDFASQLCSTQRLATRKPASSVIQDWNGEPVEGMETPKGTGPSSAASLKSRPPKPMAVALAPASQASLQPDAKTVHQNTGAAAATPQASVSQEVRVLRVRSTGAEGTEACLNDLDLLSIKDPSKMPPPRPTVLASPFKGCGGKEEAFQLDHAALLSILRDEGVGPAKPQNYQPRRVTVSKSHQKAGAITGPRRVPKLSVDPAATPGALRPASLERTPGHPARPPGRGTSVHTPRRVPVTKPRGETPGAPPVTLHEGTPVMRWTPQRVPNTRNQPMSATASLHGCLSARPMSRNPLACTSDPRPHNEDVVQRLFDDQEDEQHMTVSDGEPAPRADRPAERGSTTGGVGGGDVVDSRKEEVVEEEVEEVEEEEEEEETRGGARPFLQEPHRESVIFFSTGKKLFRAPRVEKPGAAVQPGREGERGAADLPIVTLTRPEFDPTRLGTHFVSGLQRDFPARKNCAAASPAVALMLKRRLQLDELRLDEEVATYTSCPAPRAQPFQPPRPRCGNPLASFLHFQESTTFVPVGCGSPPASPLRAR